MKQFSDSQQAEIKAQTDKEPSLQSARFQNRRDFMLELIGISGMAITATAIGAYLYYDDPNHIVHELGNLKAKAHLFYESSYPINTLKGLEIHFQEPGEYELLIKNHSEILKRETLTVTESPSSKLYKCNNDFGGSHRISKLELIDLGNNQRREIDL